GRADEEDVRLRDLDRGLIVGGVQRAGRTDPLVVVVHRDRERPLRRLLPDDVLLEELEDLLRLRQLELRRRLLAGLRESLSDDLVAELHAFITDVDARARDQLLDLL